MNSPRVDGVQKRIAQFDFSKRRAADCGWNGRPLLPVPVTPVSERGDQKGMEFINRRPSRPTCARIGRRSPPDNGRRSGMGGRERHLAMV